MTCCVCSYKELECLTPHMCNVCWVNDHMYCRNMKRIFQELPSFTGGCIHYIACEHYRQSGTSVQMSQESHGKSMSLHWTNRHDADKLPSHGVVSVEDLLCDEDMLDSESDLSSDGIEGTELLQIQLKARTDQIFRSLGITQLPKSKSPPPTSIVPESTVWIGEDTVGTEEDTVLLEPEEYGAEVLITADGECVEDLAEIHSVSDATLEAFTASKQERETFFKDDAHWTRDSDYHASSSTCSLASFDGTPAHEPPVTVMVHVRQISDNRVVIKYPKYHSALTEYIRLDVTFPNGATDEVINSYVKNDVARFICDKKSGLVPHVPVSVTVVKDDESSQTTEAESVSIVQGVVESHCNGFKSTIHTVSNCDVS